MRHVPSAFQQKAPRRENLLKCIILQVPPSMKIFHTISNASQKHILITLAATEKLITYMTNMIFLGIIYLNLQTLYVVFYI